MGASLEELCPSGAEHEERDVGEPADQMLDEIDRRIVRPVQVLEYEHRRSVRGEVLDEPPPRGERFCLAITEQRSASVETDEGAQVTFDPLGLVMVADDRRYGFREHRRRGLRLVRFQQARLGFHDLPKGPERPRSPYGGERPSRQRISSGR